MFQRCIHEESRGSVVFPAADQGLLVLACSRDRNVIWYFIYSDRRYRV